MKFTPEQIQRVQKLPGCTAVTDEALTSAETIVAVSEQALSQVTALKTENEQLKQKVAALPVVPSAEALAERVENKCERVDLMVEKGNITKVQAETLKSAIKADPAGMLCAAPGKKASFDIMLETLGQGKAGVASGEASPNQPLPNNPQEPTRDVDSQGTMDVKKAEEEGRKQGEEHKKAQLAARGINK